VFAVILYEETNEMKFSISIFPVVLFTILLLAIPIFHLVVQRDLRPALQINIDIVSNLVGLLGIFLCSALVSLHRRLAALEKSKAAEMQRS
jgi:hypothetical protein